VVCAGAKSILDLPKTLEYLETQGVCVVGYGTDDLPAFFTPHSGLPLAARVNSPDAMADLLESHRCLGLSSGVVLAVPVPDKLGVEAASIEEATKKALSESQARGVKGGEVTPFLLKRINELSGGESLAANIALVKNNVTIGGAVARAWASLRRRKALGASKL